MTTTDASVATPVRGRATLPLRVELVRQFRRRRTLVTYALLVLLPLIVVAAVKFGPSADSGGGGRRFGGGGLDLVGLATGGAWNFAVTMLFFATSFLLVLVTAIFLGDTVASEAQWATLRYLLAAPVPRRRLLWQKLMVGLISTAGGIVLLVGTSYLVGLVAFGSGSLQSPAGGSYDGLDAVMRVGVIGGYIFVSLLFTAGIAFLMTVSTDVPLAAVGTALILVIVSSILDAIEALGDLRQWLPTEYTNAWIGALQVEIEWSDMVRGAAYSLVAFAVLVLVAFLRFDRKDIVS
jgi:ABC-2 type transport system permease protein